MIRVEYSTQKNIVIKYLIIFDELVKKAIYLKFKNLRLLFIFMIKIIAFIAFLVMFGWNLIENFMSVYLSNKLTNTEISIVFISIYLSFSVSSLLAIGLMGRPKLMVTLGSALYSPFMLLIALNPNLFLLIVLGILVGIGASLFFIGSSYYVLLSKNRGKTAGIFSGSVSAGSGLAGLFGGYFLLNNSFQNLFAIGVVVLLTGSILNYFLLKEEQSEKSVVNISYVISLLRNEEVIKIGILTFLGILFYGVSKSFVPIVTKEIGGTVLDVGLYTFTLVIFSLIVAIIGGTLTDKIGRKFGFYIIMILSATCSFLVLIAKEIFIIFIVGSLFSFINVLTRSVSLASMGDYIKNGLIAGALVVFYISMAATFSLLLFGVLRDLRFPFLIIGMISLLSVFLVKKLNIK